MIWVMCSLGTEGQARGRAPVIPSLSQFYWAMDGPDVLAVTCHVRISVFSMRISLEKESGALAISSLGDLAVQGPHRRDPDHIRSAAHTIKL
jgi:hypothetical protein